LVADRGWSLFSACRETRAGHARNHADVARAACPHAQSCRSAQDQGQRRARGRAQFGRTAMSAEKIVHVYTDGACKGNPGRGGWGAWLKYGERTRELYVGE